MIDTDSLLNILKNLFSKRKPADLPLVLGGPILRRVESERVCIWLATSRSVSVRAEIYVDSVKRIPLGSSANNQREGVSQVQLGDNLFIHLFEVRPTNGGSFPLDTLLFYNLWLDDHDLKKIDVLDLIVYPNSPLPSFFLPRTLSTILHGSCRKPHGSATWVGNSNVDALSFADELIADSLTVIENRPAILFLTGDQIYADDVAAPLLLELTELGRKLTGGQETVPEIGDCLNIQLFGRRNALKKSGSGFTSDNCENHLLTFGEYAAMHLFVWGGLAFELPKWQEVEDSIKGLNQRAREKLRKKYEQQLQQLEQFMVTLPKVRRVLANLPTYMIFDDHEVTDDWNLNRSWHHSVSGSPCGRRLVSNALAAYWAFQGWGNHPESFSPEFVSALSKHLMAKKSDGVTAAQFDQILWNKTNWGYAVPTDPPVVVLDTRMQREFDSRRRPSQLMNADGRQWLTKTWEELKSQNKPAGAGTPGLIVISATPVYGFEPVEFLQKVLVAFGIKPIAVDFESWIANRQGFGLFLRAFGIEQPKWCLFLSGDVHYSFTTRAEFENEGQMLKVLQATSSPLFNESQGVDILEELSRKSRHIERRFGWRDEQNVPFHYRIWRPFFDFAVRWNLVEWDTKKRPIWKDKLEGILPEGINRLVSKNNNLGVVRFQNGEPVAHELKMVGKVVRFPLT